MNIRKLAVITIMAVLLAVDIVSAEEKSASYAARPEPPLHPGYTRELNEHYLVHETFWDLNTYFRPQELILSGWESNSDHSSWDFAGANPKGDCGDLRLIDKMTDDGVMIRRCFPTQDRGRLTFEYRFKLPNRMDGVTWQLRSGSTSAINIVTDKENLSYVTASGEKKVIQPYKVNQSIGVRVIADIDKHISDIYVDGILRASSVPFCNAVKNINYVYIKTGIADTGFMFPELVSIHKGYLACEKFLSTAAGNIPDDWTRTTAGGSVAVEVFKCESKPDIYSVKLDDTNNTENVSLSTSFPETSTKTEFWYKFLLPAKQDGVSFELRNAGKPAFTMTTSDGNICYIDSKGKPVTIVPSYLANLWYAVRVIVDPVTDKAEIYINHKKKCTDAEIRNDAVKFDNIRFATSLSDRGTMWVDDVKVYPYHDDPSDYPTEPVPAPHGDLLIGIQSCHLYQEGRCSGGWERIYPSRAIRKPRLGWYDEGKPEVADWETKWQVEHGIDFEIYCWYRYPTLGSPIKRTPHDMGLIDGFLDSKYKKYKKFAIMYVGDSVAATSDDFRKHTVPFWIEYFFKDPSYLIIDNKPVISWYGNDTFKKGQLTKSDVTYLEQKCIESGFAGIINMEEYRGSNKKWIEGIKGRGMDYFYAYCEADQRRLVAQRDIAASIDGLGMIPSINNGWDTTCWRGLGPGGSLKTTQEYLSDVKWLKHTLLPSMPEGELGRRMVLMGNWNEFGEGHYLMPSAERGFDHIDAIRDVFTTGSQPNIEPNENQRRRINVWFPKE